MILPAVDHSSVAGSGAGLRAELLPVATQPVVAEHVHQDAAKAPGASKLATTACAQGEASVKASILRCSQIPHRRGSEPVSKQP